ncbi:3-methyladenine DNA glycosylase [Georgenia thermotolerans]|uniref:3-methyladenine DNA glycosylase n=1 Tax=Georgenia thermotolerans TaxID=527326 RepID=A0A7J5ULE7_9MICO|nr:3-methyladenine DNA glycosylase [Georgenia thermotolerans]KAE8763182.1 3-methyladenine DNA glycosylase [Georgenia thermotolerans]
MTAPALDVAVLPATEWRARAEAHAGRADALTAAHRERRSRRLTHPIEDFLYEYYSVRPARLRRWHPGVGVALAGTADELAERAAWRWTATATAGGVVVLDVAAYLADRGEGVRWLHELLRRTAGRPAHLGCLGLHEWAMVYRQEAHRHPLPLRLGQAGTDAVVESHPVRCTHYDAFRFFTAPARPLNRLQPARATQLDLEQPGCLHANMDLLKTALKLGPACPGGLLLDCFELARDIRVLDMRASPYDVTGLGHSPVAIETAAGRAEYVAQQRAFAGRAEPLRDRLLTVTTALLEGAAA